MSKAIKYLSTGSWLALVFATIVLFSGLILPLNVAHADQVIATIPLGTWPTELGIGVNPNTNMIYVAANGFTTKAGPVIVIDGNTNTIVSRITVGPDTLGLGVNPNTNKIYVANANTNMVTVIDGSTNSVVGTIPVRHFPEGIGVNPNTNKIYVANLGNDTVSVIDGTTNSVVSTIPVGNGPAGISVNPNTNMIYVANNGGNTVSVINGATNSVVSTTPVGNGPIGVGVNPTTNMIYVSNLGYWSSSGQRVDGNTISVIDGSTNNVVGIIPVGTLPLGVGVNPNTNKIYVTNHGGCCPMPPGTVSVIDGTTNSVIGTIPVGKLPNAVGVNPDTARIYVANNENQTISVIDDSSPPSNATSQLTINSQDNNGNAISGFQAELYSQNGTLVSAGSTPYTFTLYDNQIYTVHVKDYEKYVFGHWQDTGLNNATRVVSISSDRSITAAYETIPQPPTNLSATAASSSQMNLSWNAPSNDGGSAITGYKIERSTDGGATWSTTVSNTGNTGTVYSDTGLSSNTTYTYQVSAINLVGVGTPSKPASGTTSLLSVAGVNVGPASTLP